MAELTVDVMLRKAARSGRSPQELFDILLKLPRWTDVPFDELKSSTRIDIDRMLRDGVRIHPEPAE